MSEQQNDRPVWQWADAKLVGFVGPGTSPNGRVAFYQFAVEVQVTTSSIKPVVHQHLIAFDGNINQKSVDCLGALFPTWNKKLLETDPVAALDDLDRVGTEMGNVEGMLPASKAFKVRVAYVLRPWKTREGEARTSFDTKTMQESKQRPAARRGDIAAAFGKAPPPPARAPRAAAPKAPVAYTHDANGAYACYLANGGKEEHFWDKVAGIAGKTELLAEEWVTVIAAFTAPPASAPPVAPPAKPVVKPNPLANGDPDSDLPF